MNAIAKPAPFVLKPFAGIYNPFSRGCSLLCNHPTDTYVKECLKKARDGWATDQTVAEADVLGMRTRDRVTLEGNQLCSPKVEVCIPQVDSVPEELFRRYTDTDSRPQTPAPTLASGTTMASNSRRCFTPDPFSSDDIREKTQLILDLRRSHSQENLTRPESLSSFDPPIIRIQQVLTRPSSLEELKVETPKISKPVLNTSKRPETVRKTENAEKDRGAAANDTDGDDDAEFVKRRGKRRRKKGSGASKGATTYQASLDPETQEILPCLNLVMGKPLAPEQFEYVKKLTDLSDDEQLRFKECCGVFALCERLLAPQFCARIPDRKADPCHEIEKADFDMLQRKLDGRQISDNLREILLLIQTL